MRTKLTPEQAARLREAEASGELEIRRATPPDPTPAPRRPALRAEPAPEAEPSEDELEAERNIVDDIDDMPPIVPAITEVVPEPLVVAEDDGFAEEDRRAQLVKLYGVDREIVDLLDLDEIEEIIAAEKKRADDERKKSAKAAFRSLALQRERIAAGLIPENDVRSAADKKRMAEKVTVEINIPGEGAGHREHGLRVDQQLYRNGTRHTVSRAVAESLVSMMYQAWFAEMRFSLLDQDKPGRSAREVLSRQAPRFVIEDHGA